MTSVNIAGLDKAAVLTVLFNRALRTERGPSSPLTTVDMDHAEAVHYLLQQPLDQYLRFGYVLGHALLVNLQADSFDAQAYDALHGTSAAESALESIRFHLNPIA